MAFFNRRLPQRAWNWVIATVVSVFVLIFVYQTVISTQNLPPIRPLIAPTQLQPERQLEVKPTPGARTELHLVNMTRVTLRRGFGAKRHTNIQAVTRRSSNLKGTLQENTTPLVKPVRVLKTVRLDDQSPAKAKRTSKDKLEKRQVIFAKVHKSASSTIQNILLRFAMARDLDALLPGGAYSIPSLSEYSSKIPENIVPHSPGKPFDILCNHIIFDEKEIAPFFPKNTPHVAILREPLKQALSALAYYATEFSLPGIAEGFKRYADDPINSFLNHPEHFYKPELGPAQSYINNRMSVDLGFNADNFTSSKTDKNQIRDFVKKIEELFHLVLIAEYFDESMVLLKRSLNWSMNDIIYIKVNVASQKSDPAWNKKPLLTATQLLTFRRWAAVDYELYHHFLTVFSEKIEKEPLFMDEVEAFKTVQTSVHDFCTSNEAQREPLEIAAGRWTEGFTVTEYDCNIMKLSEFELVRRARVRQSERYYSLVS